MTELPHQPIGSDALLTRLEAREAFDAHLFEATSALGDYCVNQGIEDIILLDRSARATWVGLWEYLKLAHPDSEKPRVHFMSPAVIDLNFRANNFNRKEQRELGKMHLSNQRVAIKELEASNDSLLEHKDATVLVFDACIHTGGSILGTKELLKSIGFTDVRVGVFTDDRSTDALIPSLDFAWTSDQSVIGCKPYGFDDGLEIVPSIYIGDASSINDNIKRSRRRTIERELVQRYYAQSQEVS